MIGLGGSILCSVSKAEFDDKSSNSYFSVSISSLCIFGIIITIIGLIFSNDILSILCRSQQLLPMVNSFYSVILLGIPFLCYLMSVSYFVRVDGMPNLAFRAILLANIVNLCCDVIFMGVLKIGIGGAAWATLVGYAVGSIFI